MVVFTHAGLFWTAVGLFCRGRLLVPPEAAQFLGLVRGGGLVNAAAILALLIVVPPQTHGILLFYTPDPTSPAPSR